MSYRNKSYTISRLSEYCTCFSDSVISPTCSYCGEPCYDDQGLPYKTFDYLPIIHQLRLRWADSTQAMQLKSYRVELNSKPNPENAVRDFWDGSWAAKLQKQGILKMLPI